MASLYKSATLGRTATKISGYGSVPGQKQSKPYGGIPGSAPAVGLSAPANTVPNFTPQTPAGASYAGAQAGAAPQLSTAASGGAVAHGDPRDPTYWTDVAKINDTFGSNESKYNLQQTQAQTSRDNALAALDKQQPVDTSNARGQYNNSGLFYSSRLTGAEGNITSAYEKNRNDTKAGFTNLVDQLGLLRADNQKQYGKGPNGELTGTAYLDALNAGVGRATAADQAAAQANLLAGLNADGSPKAAPAQAPQPGGMVNGQFQSQILSPGVTGLINQWINQSKNPLKVTSSKPQKTTGR